MKKIIIIEDEKDLADLLSFNLSREGYRVAQAYDGVSGLALVQQEQPDLVLLDLMIPGLMGTEVCRRIKADSATAAIPILMVTARGEEMDRVVGFELGADDYVTKPFSMRELTLRIAAILRRGSTGKEPEGLPVLVIGSIRLELETHRVLAAGEEIPLTGTEFKLLQTLAERKGRLQDRERLLNDVWGYASDVDSRTVDTHITRLRTKLGEAGGQIKTVRGFGYKLEET